MDAVAETPWAALQRQRQAAKRYLRRLVCLRYAMLGFTAAAVITNWVQYQGVVPVGLLDGGACASIGISLTVTRGLRDVLLVFEPGPGRHAGLPVPLSRTTYRRVLAGLLWIDAGQVCAVGWAAHAVGGWYAVAFAVTIFVAGWLYSARLVTMIDAMQGASATAWYAVRFAQERNVRRDGGE